MAGFGGEYARFAKFLAEETSAAAPTYDVPVSLGPFVSGNLTITNASGELHGDNVLQEKVDKFASGAIPMEVTDCPKASIAVVYGATYAEENKSVDYGADDEAPYGAVTYIRNILRKGKEVFEANFYAKAQAARTTDNTQTRSGSITFQNTTINWTIMDPLHKATKWQSTAEFDTYDEAAAWLDEKLGALTITITSQPDDATVGEGAITESLSIVASAGGKSRPPMVREHHRINRWRHTLSGATALFAIPNDLTEVGSPYYYYCVVSGEGLDSVTSEVVTVTVEGN